jgi:hypothetical protein
VDNYEKRLNRYQAYVATFGSVQGKAVLDDLVNEAMQESDSIRLGALWLIGKIHQRGTTVPDKPQPKEDE